MQSSALILMLTSEVIITGLTMYFFLKVLFTKPKREPDSYSKE